MCEDQTNELPWKDEDDFLRLLHYKDQRIFRYFYDRHFSEIDQFVRSMVADPDATCDIVSDVFMVWWDNSAKKRTPEHIKHYLFRAARSRSISHLKKIGKERKDKKDYLYTQPRPVEENGFEDRQWLAQVKALLLREMDKLSPQGKKILGHRLDGKDDKTIGEEMGISVQHVNVQLKRVIATIKKLWPPDRYIFLILWLSFWKW